MLSPLQMTGNTNSVADILARTSRRNILSRQTIFVLLLSGYSSHRRSARLFSERKHAVLFWGFGRPRSRAGLFDQFSLYTALPEGFLYFLDKKLNKVDFG
jgi:hypothetical protein